MFLETDIMSEICPRRLMEKINQLQLYGSMFNVFSTVTVYISSGDEASVEFRTDSQIFQPEYIGKNLT